MKPSTIIFFLCQIIESLDNGDETRHNLGEESHTKDLDYHREDFLNVCYRVQVSVSYDCKGGDHPVADSDKATENIGLVLNEVRFKYEFYSMFLIVLGI